MVDDFLCVPASVADAEVDAAVTESTYLLNEDFENGKGEIIAGDGPTSLSVKTSGGVDNSAYLSCVSTHDFGGIKKTPLTIEPNRVYKISWWAKADDDVALGQYLASYFIFSGFGNTPGTIQVRANGKILLRDSTGYTVTMNTGSEPQAGHYTVIVGIDAMDGYTDNHLAVSVNGVQAKQIGDVPKATGFTWKESTSSEPAAQHVSETAPRVMQFTVEDLSAIRNGENTITITNTATGKPQSVKWLEVQVDGTKGAKPLEMK